MRIGPDIKNDGNHCHLIGSRERGNIGAAVDNLVVAMAIIQCLHSMDEETEALIEATQY